MVLPLLANKICRLKRRLLLRTTPTCSSLLVKSESHLVRRDHIRVCSDKLLIHIVRAGGGTLTIGSLFGGDEEPTHNRRVVSNGSSEFRIAFSHKDKTLAITCALSHPTHLTKASFQRATHQLIEASSQAERSGSHPVSQAPEHLREYDILVMCRVCTLFGEAHQADGQAVTRLLPSLLSLGGQRGLRYRGTAHRNESQLVYEKLANIVILDFAGGVSQINAIFG